jgi:5'(3')-deoxyribonucleotidase
MNRIFIDLDGVLVDFDAYKSTHGLTGDEAKKKQNAYLEMSPIPDALQSVRSLIGMGYEVWVATKPPTGVAFAYADKAQWVLDHLPELKRRIIITHDKGLLGDQRDYLIDDRPHRANCEKFSGELITFKPGEWPAIVEKFSAKHKALVKENARISEYLEKTRR